MKNNNNPVFINYILDYKSNYLNHTLLNQKPEKLKKKKVRKFLRIKRRIKANNNIKRITNKKKIKIKMFQREIKLCKFLLFQYFPPMKV